jgi:hypothetical protein
MTSGYTAPLRAMQPLRHQRLSAWIALVAMLAMALLPTLSHALAHARGGASSWAEVCTPQGMRLVAVSADDSLPGGAPAQAAGHLEHCPLCALGADALAPPLSLPPALVLPLGRAGLPPLFLQAPHTLHAWRSAQPRGPPSVS